MRQSLHSLAKRLVYGGFLLILAVSMGFVFSEVAQAQSDPNSCEVNPVPMRVPSNLFDSGVSARVSRADNMSHAKSRLDIEVDKAENILVCGANHNEPFFTPPLQYSMTVDKIYIKSTSTIKHQTVIVSCLPMTRSDFPSNPDSDVATYTEPWVNFNSSQTFNVPADGVIRHNVEQLSKSFGFQSTLTANGQTYPLTALSNMWMSNEWSVVNYDNSEVVYSKLIPNQAIAITYLEYGASLSYVPRNDLSLSDQRRRELNSFLFVSGMQSLADATADVGVDQQLIVDAWSGNLSYIEPILGAAADSMIAHPDKRVMAAGVLLRLDLFVYSVLSGFTQISEQIALAELQNLYPYQYGELYSMNEVSLDNRSSEVKNKLNQLGIAAPYTRLLSVRWHASSRTLEVAGSGFNPRSSLFLQLRKPDNSVVKTITLHALSNGYYPQSNSYARSVYLDFGQLYTKFFFEPGASIPTGCYFLSAYVWEQNQATVVTARAGNFVWIDGDPNYVPPQSLTLSIPGSGSASPDRTCANPVSLLTQHANLFNGLNCGGDITWFSAHPENGPSANSSSLYVPSNSVVKVASQDNGGGETACFNSTQTDLGAWRNKIQWTQLVPGGSCPVVTADGYIVHTNQGDFRVNNGQTWDNVQHNRQILGFDRQGSVHLKINHVNGAQRCWDETKSAQQLQNDGDWWIQTRSIEIGSGYCPGMSGQLEVYSLANYQGGRHDIRAGNIRTYPVNDLKYSFKFTQPGMSAKFTNADNRTRCFNQNTTNLQDFEDYWRTTVKIEVLGTDVCPPVPTVPTANQFAAGSGVYFRYYEYEGGFPGLPVSSTWQPHRTGSVGNFSLFQVGHRENAFAIAYRSCLSIPTSGTYTFFLISDDGSELYLNGSLLVDNDGHHPVQERFGQVTLSAGVHTLEVQYFEGGVDQSLGVAWAGPGFTKQWIPNNNLSTTGCSVVADQMPSDPVGANVARNKHAYAVAQGYGLATQAVDGNLSTSWNGSGLAPRWIEIDLGAEYTIQYIQGVPNQYPSGESHHQTWLAGENRQFYLYSETKSYTQAGARVILHNPATRPTGKARYVRIYTVSSPSWVSWYEVEVYSSDTPNLPVNLALNKTATASGNASTAPQSFDGNRTMTGWNANGLAPQWIEVDLGAEYQLTTIAGYVNQSPAGPTTHQVWLAGNDHQFTLYSEVQSETQRYQLVPLTNPDQTLSPLTRYVRVVTTSSPSWVTWYEIEVYGQPGVMSSMVGTEELQVPVQLYLPIVER